MILGILGIRDSLERYKIHWLRLPEENLNGNPAVDKYCGLNSPQTNIMSKD